MSCLEKLHALEAENALLKAENADLRACLGLDSVNSHQPPSSDGYKKAANLGSFPAWVASPVSYGEKVLSFASLLNVGYQMPFEKILPFGQ